MEDEAREKLLKMKKSELVDEVLRLKDENESLWDIMDELKKSEIEAWGKSNKEVLQDMVNEHIKKLMWMNRMKGEA